MQRLTNSFICSDQIQILGRLMLFDVARAWKRVEIGRTFIQRGDETPGKS